MISALLEEAMAGNHKPDGGSIQASKLAGERLGGKLEKGVGLKKELVDSAV